MKKLQLFLAAIVTFTMLQFTTFAQTNVSGGIYANTTWTLAGSPYIVTDTVVLFPGVTLTIQPGVMVKFNNNNYMEIRDANIIANGTITDSITFTSNSGAPSPGIWQGIRVTGNVPNNANIFNYCNFRYAIIGINSYGGSTDTLKLKNSIFYKNNCGLDMGNYNYNTIDSNKFINNIGSGIIIQSGGSSHINDCYFSNNATGIDGGSITTFFNCTFRSNTTAITNSNGKILSCIINNNQKGIDYLGGNSVTIKNCTIDSNSIVGVHLNGNDSLINCHLDYNGTAIISQSTQNTIVMCTIENNGTGISLTATNANIYCNKICNNTNYGMSYTGVPNISFPNNYWCTPDSTSTSAVIHDGYDNVIYGLVNFMPLDTVSCYLTGCNLHITATVTNATCATCPNGSAAATIVNGRPPYTYTWYTAPIQTTHIATGLHYGWYHICVTDANLCSTCDSVYVDSTNCTGFSISTSAINATCSSCNDGSALAVPNGGAAPYNYTWYTAPIQTTALASALSQGIYHVCITDHNGCTVCDSAIVSIGNCSAHFNLFADTIPQNYVAVNMASGVMPLTYLWSWGDGTYDSTAYPNHTYATSGFYTITLTITDSVGCTNTYSSSYYLLTPISPMIHVNVVASTSLGINNISKDEELIIFPNPATSTLTIETQNSRIENVKLYNVLGSEMLNRVQHNERVTVDISGFSKGIYFLQITDDNKKVVNKKVVLQ